MTLVFEDRAAALAALQPQKSLGDNDALWENTASALHACCQGHPWWLIINGAGTAVTTMQKLVSMKIQCASGTEGKHRGGTNWGQPMLVKDRVVMLWQTDINHTSERASVQLFEVASTISISALDANEIALITGCAHLPRGGMDPGATFPHAIVATTLMSDERSSGGSEGWRKSGAGGESWGVATADVSDAGLVTHNWLDPQLVWMDGSSTPVGGGAGYSDARRQWAWLVAITSPDDLDVVRQECSRYDACCNFRGMPMPKSPTMSAASQSVSGDGSRGAPVGGVRSPDGAPMPHSHETHLFAAASRPEALHVGGSVSRTQSGAPSAGAESKWEWDCSAGRQEVWVSGDTAAQAISWPDGAPMSRSHETHLYAAASRPEARHVGGSALQTHGIVAAMRLRGGGGTDDRRHEAQHQRAKEGSGEAAVWADRMLKQLAGSEGKRRMHWCNTNLVTKLVTRRIFVS